MNNQEIIKTTNLQGLLIKGNSKTELKKLEFNFKDKVNMIYIDPPYNTNRKDMQYDDNRTEKEFQELLIETLKTSYNLLKETGSIFISISSKNVHILRNILDEIYGKKNYHSTIIRKENAKKQKIGKTSLKENYELIVVYSKNKNKSIINNIQDEEYIDFKKNIINLKKIINKELYISDYLELKTENITFAEIKILKKIWKNIENRKGLFQYKYISKENRIFRAGDINMYCGKGYDYKLIHPITKKICKIPKYQYPHIDKINGWELKENNELIYIGEIEYISKNKLLCGNLILGIDEKKIPDYANELDIEQLPDTIINITGSDDIYLTKLMNEKVFDYPKPVKLLEYLIKIGTKENDFVLDFFAGSGTTGEAACNLNRKFILIQKPEILNYKLKDENLKTVFDITAKRLKQRNIVFEIVETI